MAGASNPYDAVYERVTQKMDLPTSSKTTDFPSKKVTTSFQTPPKESRTSWVLVMTAIIMFIFGCFLIFRGQNVTFYKVPVPILAILLINTGITLFLIKLSGLSIRMPTLVYRLRFKKPMFNLKMRVPEPKNGSGIKRI